MSGIHPTIVEDANVMHPSVGLNEVIVEQVHVVAIDINRRGATKILLPNAESRNTGIREFYGRLGLNERELDILQVSIPKKHYYIISKLGRRLVDLGVGKVALAWVGVNGKEERQSVESVMEQFPDTWRSEWLRLKGLGQWADYFATLSETEQEEEEYLCARVS